MAGSASSTEPGFFSYFSPEELATIRSHLPPHPAATLSTQDLVEKCVALVGVPQMLAAVKSHIPAPTYSWTSHTVIVSSRQVARWGHSLTIVDDRLYLYGGRGADQYCRSSFYYLDLRTMRGFYIKTSRFPKAREGHSCVHYKDSLYLYGGCEGGGDEPEIFFSDLHAFDMQDKKWRTVRTSGECPAGRDGHSCGVIKDYMLVYGGCTAEGLSGEVFTFNFPRSAWTKHQTIGWNPGKRESSGSCVVGDTMFLFGGNVNDDRNQDDICASDLFTFRVVSGKVVCEQVHTFGPSPPSRVSHTLTAVDEHCFTLIGGEKDKELLSDVWIYYIDYRYWAQVQSQTPLCSKMAHCAVAYRNKVLIFGGMDKDSLPRSELITLTLHNHSFAETQGETNYSNSSVGKCFRCGHRPHFCEQLEDGLRFPGFNCFSRVVPSAELIREVAEHYSEPYLPLLALARLLGGSVVKIDLISSDVQVASVSPNEVSSDSSTSTVADGPSNKVIQLQSSSALPPEKLSQLCGSQLLGLLAAISTQSVVISRTADYFCVLLVKFLEESAHTPLLVYDREGNCVYPDQSLYLKTLDAIVKDGGMPLANLMSHGRGLTVYLYSKLYLKRVGAISAPVQHPSFSLSDFLQYANHHPPTSQQFIVANTLVSAKFAPEDTREVTWERNSHFVKCCFRATGPSSIRVYYSNALVYLWVDESAVQKRPRSDVGEHTLVELLSEKYLSPDMTLNVQLAWGLLMFDMDC